MMGDRDYRGIIKTTIEKIGNELETHIDTGDLKTIHLHEVTKCLRRSYYDRTDPVKQERHAFNELFAGLLRRFGYGSDSGIKDLDGTTLNCQADTIVDDVVMIFRTIDDVPKNPVAGDIMYLNACLWIYNKTEGLIIYITSGGEETSFAVARDGKMYEETIRRVRVLEDLLKAKNRPPILEPSSECNTCQYYQRCYARERVGRTINLKEMIGLEKS